MHKYYSGLKVFHFGEKLASLTRENPTVRPPLHIRLKPTNFCNHRCSYCAYRAGNLQLGQDMDQKDAIGKDKMIEIVDDLAELGVKAVTFSGGGEPFCYPHLAMTLPRLHDAGIRFASLTNGSLLRGELAELFAHLGTWLRISLDGWDDASYAAYRGIEVGAFTRLLSNIEHFAKLGGRCALGVSLIIDERNHAHIHETTGRLRDLGVTSVKISPCIVSNDVEANNAYHERFHDEAWEQAQKAAADFNGEGFEVMNLYHKLEGRFNKTYTWCPFLQILTVIGADLNVYSCQDKAYNLKSGCLGSIRDTRFKNFWMHGKGKFFDVNPARDCGHHCVANAKNLLLHEFLGLDREHLSFV